VYVLREGKGKWGAKVVFVRGWKLSQRKEAGEELHSRSLVVWSRLCSIG
jgi:hypothetical protein